MSRRSLRVLLRSSSCSVRNRCRSSSALNSSSASGLTVPSIASSRSAVRSRFCLLLADERRRLGSRVRRLAARLAPSARGRPGPAGRGRSRSTSTVGVEPELLERALLELLDPHLLLGAGHLVAVHRVDQLVVLAGQVAQPARGRRAAAPRVPGGRCSTSARAAAAWSIETSSRASTSRDRRRRRPRRPRPRGAAARGARSRAPGSRARPGRRAVSWSARPCRARDRSSAVRSASRASISAWPGLAGQPRRAARASSSSGSRLGVVLGAAPAGASSSASPARSLLAGLLGLVDGPLEPLGLAAGRARLRRRTGRAPRPPRRGSRRTRAAWRGRRRPAAGPRAARRSSRDMSKPSRSRGGDRLGELRARLVDRGLDLDQARLAGRAAGGDVGAEQVAVPGHRGEVEPSLATSARAAVRSSTTATRSSSWASAGRTASGQSTDVDGVRRARRAAPASALTSGRGAGPPPSDQPGPAEVVAP